MNFPDQAPVWADAEHAELKAIAAESIGWQPLADGVYLHLVDADSDEVVIQVVGVPDVSMAGANTLLLVG